MTGNMLEIPNGWRKDWRRGAERRVTDADMGSSKLLMVRIINSKPTFHVQATGVCFGSVRLAETCDS
jgi:hypothetical protein